jgi:PBP1b-binding outer membrane lipoprotein LpoB
MVSEGGRMRYIILLTMALLLAGCATTEVTRYEFAHNNVYEALTWVLTNAKHDRIAVEIIDGRCIIDGE